MYEITFIKSYFNEENKPIDELKTGYVDASQPLHNHIMSLEYADCTIESVTRVWKTS